MFKRWDHLCRRWMKQNEQIVEFPAKIMGSAFTEVHTLRFITGRYVFLVGAV